MCIPALAPEATNVLVDEKSTGGVSLYIIATVVPALPQLHLRALPPQATQKFKIDCEEI
jgi:hypothetical protein